MSGRDGSGDIPLFVSVVGHSDVREEDYSEIDRKLEALFDELTKFKSTRVYLMTALSIGSEMEAVKVAMKRGIGIAPVLPTDVESYKKISENHDGFEGYCKDFDRVMEDPKTLSPVFITTFSGINERQSFRNVSTFLIKNSHIMVAIWDGRPYSRDGGTFDTLRMAYNGIDVNLRKRYREEVKTRNDAEIPINYLDVAEDCLLYWIKVDRKLDDSALLEKGCRDLEVCGSDGGYVVPRTMYDADSGEPSVSVETKCLSFRVQEEMPLAYRKIMGRIDALNHEISSDNSDKNVRECCE